MPTECVLDPEETTCDYCKLKAYSDAELTQQDATFLPPMNASSDETSFVPKLEQFSFQKEKGFSGTSGYVETLTVVSLSHRRTCCE